MKLTKNIAGFLFAAGKISFPGFGSLVLIKENAKRNPVKNKIYGPKYSCSFLYNEYDEQNSSKFIAYHSKKNQLELKTADEEFKKLSMHLLNQIAEKNKASLEGLGTFIKTDDGIIFSFSSGIQEVLEMSYQDYPLLVFKAKEIPEMPFLVNDGKEIITSERPAPQTMQEIQVTPRKPVLKKKTSITGIVISAAAALAFICFMICVLNVFDGSKASDEIAAHEAEEAYPEKIPSIIEDDDVFEYQDTARKTILSDTADRKPEMKLELPPALYEISKRGDLYELIDNSILLRNYFGKQTNIVICGSFRKRSNAIYMLNKIRRNDYNAFAENYDGFIRVGVISDLSIKTEENMLREIQNTIEEKSWIMLPPQD